MGVILLSAFFYCGKGSIPHTRGGDPKNQKFKDKFVLVFPTHVGVIPIEDCVETVEKCIPHTRGGDPDC